MRRAEHEQRAVAFRRRLADQAARPRDAQEWPDIAEWPTLEATATCRTPGCPVQGRPYPVRLHENADGVYRATCGRCNRPHVELLADFDDEKRVNVAARRSPAPSGPPPRSGSGAGREQGPVPGPPRRERP